MNKFFATAMAAIMAFTLATNTPTEAQAGKKERALAVGLVVGAAAAAAIMSQSGSKKFRRHTTTRYYPNDECGPGYRMKRGRCVLRGNGFRKAKKIRFGKKFKVRNFKKRPAWQIQAIRKGCAPGMGWNKYEGCHEND